MPKSGSTLGRALDVLLLFGEERSELTIEEISELIQAPRSTTYRYVRSLRSKGLLERSGRGSFCLGPTIMRLARAAHRQQAISEIALPVMRDVARQTGETVVLSRWAGHNVICVECIEGTRAVRTSFDPGQILPLHAGAPSKLLLAYAGPKDLDHYLSLPLEAFTAQTVVDLETLANQLRAIRDQGHCATESEVDIGVCDLAVPLLDSRQRVLAALSTSGPCFRMDGTVVDNHLDLLRQGAAAIQEQLVLISS